MNLSEGLPDTAVPMAIPQNVNKTEICFSDKQIKAGARPINQMIRNKTLQCKQGELKTVSMSKCVHLTSALVLEIAIGVQLCQKMYPR